MLPQKHYTYLWVVLLAFTLNACTPDDGPQPCNSTNTYFNLTTEQLNKTPYFTNPLFDTISFASNKGDTLTFALTKIDTTYFTQDANTNPNNLCSFWEHYQNITAKYTTIKGVGSFEVGVNLKSLNINVPTIKIYFNSYEFTYGLNEINNKAYVGYVGNLKVINFNYTNVLYEFNRFNQPNIKGYLNNEFGLIFITDSTSNLTYHFLNH